MWQRTSKKGKKAYGETEAWARAGGSPGIEPPAFLVTVSCDFEQGV